MSDMELMEDQLDLKLEDLLDLKCAAKIVTTVLERRRATLGRGTKAELEEAKTAILMACKIMASGACPMEVDPEEEASYADIKYDA